MTTLRWGVLAPARIARRHVVPALHAAPSCELVAVAARDAERAQAAASELGAPIAHGSLEALLADGRVDAVYVPLPNHLHAPWTIAAAEAGKHVLCEKPLALTAIDAQRMVDACEDAGVLLMEGFMYRFHPSWQTVRDVLASGRLGELRTVQTWVGFFDDDPADIRNVASSGGGALYDVGCYAIDVTRMLFGAEPTVVEAVAARDSTSGVDVLTSAVLGFGAGTATFSCSTRAARSQHVHVQGTDGHLEIEVPFNVPPDRPNRVFVTDSATGSTETITSPVADVYELEVEAFARAVLDGAPAPVAPSEGVADLRVLERIRAATAPGR
jgi:predicted dehydrogenase